MRKEDRITGVVIGDALGIGPEITIKALTDPVVYQSCRPVLIGDPDVIRRAIVRTGSNLQTVTVSAPREAALTYPHVGMISIPFPVLPSLPMGKIAPESGKAFVAWFQKAFALARSGEIKTIVYAPLNKEAVGAAGFSYHDEIDIIKDICGGDPFLLVVSIAGRYRFASIPPLHTSLLNACKAIDKPFVYRSLLLLQEALERMGIPKPVIGVSALNPHAGESGLHGHEEVEIIRPAMEEARRRGVDARGPFPPDTIFVRAKNKEFDAVLGMYHDQTRIPLKLLKFKRIVYTTLGAPVQCFSVAHGTAYDIADKWTADPDNLKIALRYAGRIR